MSPFNRLRRLLRSEKGNVLAIAAACMPLVVGAAAIGVDSIQMTLAKRQLQRAADAGALAGAYALVQIDNNSIQATPTRLAVVQAAVNRDLNLNDTGNNGPTISTKVVENAPTAGSYAGNPRAVRVVLTTQRPTPFWALFSHPNVTIRTEATAAWVYTGQFCMVSLDNTNSVGITFSGNTTVNLGCGIVTNSTSATAISASGSASVIASPIAAVGGVPSSGNYSSGTVLLPYSPPQPDPYASLPRTPSPPANCTWISLDVQPNNTLTLPASPTGNYCIHSGQADIKGTLNLANNTTYYFDGGTLNLGSQANVTGSEVTFVFTSSTPTDPSSFASISMNGGAVVNLTAPATGTYAGILMYEDPRAPFGNDYINGNSASRYQGGIYFPSRELTFNGNTGMTTTCLQLVAYQLVFSGNSNIQNSCPANSGAHAFDAVFVKLVA